MAYLLEPSIKDEVGMISVFGGQYLGIGDTFENLVEQNFGFDPQAASLVLTVHRSIFRISIRKFTSIQRIRPMKMNGENSFWKHRTQPKRRS